MGASNNPQKRRLYKGIAAGVSVLLFLVGFIAGFFTAKQMGTRDLTRCYSSVQQQQGASSALTGSGSSAPRVLPPPGSEEAQQLMKKPGALDPFEAELYTLYSDAEIITEQRTIDFLQQLEQHLAANKQQFQQQQRPGSPNTQRNMTAVLEQFQAVALDVLNYLRDRNSQALLSMLRQYSQQGTFTLADTDPDVLRQEVQQLLDVNELGKWYARVSQHDSGALTTKPTIGGQRSQGTSQTQVESGTRSTSTASNNRRLRAAPQQQRPAARHMLQAPPAASAPSAASAPAAAVPRARQLKPDAAAAAAPEPKSTAAAAAEADGPPSGSQVMNLQDMLCGVKHESPTGLQGMLLPAGGNGTSGKPIVCPPAPQSDASPYNRKGFRPVKIPVVFHCLRFTADSGVRHPQTEWHAKQSAQNLISVANSIFKPALIQFELQEVRHDPDKHSYLMRDSLEDWLECSGNPTQEEAGFPCLTGLAKLPAVASLTQQHVINVFVAGAQHRPYCMGAESACKNVYAGYVGSIGPWFTHASKTWAEGLPAENWVTINWEQFSPDRFNQERFWNGGGITFAHELAHYLGLMHTHEGGCAGDGLTLADAVPDTPVNQNMATYADEAMMTDLSAWCTAFRRGKRPNPKDLLQYNSCDSPGGVDNVFNVLSYLPNQCCMLLTDNQVARMQWVVSHYRPKMMAKYAVR